MPVNTIVATEWEQVAQPVYLLDPSTGNPMGSESLPVPMQEQADASQPVTGDMNHEPGDNAAAVITMAAPGAGLHWVISQLSWSYDDDPTGGSLAITDAGTQVFKVDITKGGPGKFEWRPAMRFSTNAAVVITLAAGGAGIAGIVNVHAWAEAD